MSLVDLHCHLDLYPDPAAELRACRLGGVTVWAVTTLPESAKRLQDLAGKAAPGLQIGIGLHPEVLHEHLHRADALIAGIADFRLVGEVGLDGSPEHRAHQADQLKVLNRILDECARRGGRLLSLHSRRAADAVLDCLFAHPEAGVPVLHWFSGTRDQLGRALIAGCWFSVGLPMLTAASGRARVAAMPRNRVLTETDGPLSKVDGQDQRPADVRVALSVLAELWGLPLEDAERQVWSNHEELMGTIKPLTAGMR